MKVKIGPYINWIGPYQIAEKILFWIPKYDENYHTNDTVHNFGTWLSGGEDRDSWLMKLCDWFHSKQKRKVKIHIDNYDVWNAHNTASMILLPLFRKLKETKHGSGFVDDADVPECIRSTGPKAWTGISEKERLENGSTDNFFFQRYDWMLNEVLWALEQDQPDNDWEAQFCHENAEIDFTKYPEDEGKVVVPIRWKNEGRYDWDGMKAYQARIDNGFRLMGKYWQTFWD